MKGRQGIRGTVGLTVQFVRCVRCVAHGGRRLNGEKSLKTVHQRTDGGE